MKQVYVCSFREGDDGERFNMPVAIGKAQDPDTIIGSLLSFKNGALLKGEQPVKLLRMKLAPEKVCYSHDWKKLEDGHYRCMDCKIPGDKPNIFGKVVPRFKDPKYKDCSWKIKPNK